METLILSVAAGAILLAILVWFLKREKPQSSQLPLGVKPLGSPPPMPHEQDKRGWKVSKKYRNKKGWRAPIGHYFDDDDCLFTDAGDMIMDMLRIESEAVSEVTPSSDFSDLQTSSPSVPISAPAPSYTPDPPSSGGGSSYGDSDGGGYDSGGGDSGGSSDD